MGAISVLRTLTVLAVAVMLLGQLSTAVAGVLLCIGDGSDPDCCSKPGDVPVSRVQGTNQPHDGSDCSCCIAVDAAPATAGAKAHGVSLEFATGTARFRTVDVSGGTRTLRTQTGDVVDTSLSSLRTVVLLN